MSHTIDLVIKIGSMALIRKDDNDLDYNIISRLATQLKPGMLLISSGATEIGRLDYLKRNDYIELKGDMDEIKADYAAQGQSILMANYRTFINSNYSIRQVLVEHSHFNDKEKRKHIVSLLKRAPLQNAIPIINYNDTVSSEESRKMELHYLRSDGSRIVECIDNDETASEISKLVDAKKMIILTSVDGIYKDPHDKSSLISDIKGKTYKELKDNIEETITYCSGTSRSGSQGAGAKLTYALEAAKYGTVVYIANAKYKLDDILKGKCNSTKISIDND